MVRIVAPKAHAGLSKAQRIFNRLIEKIDKARKRLATLQATIPLYHQKYASEFDPQWQTFNGLRADLVRLLDNVYRDKAFNKNDKAKIRDLICTIAAELITENGDDDLKSIYNQHGKTDFDAEAAEEMEAIKFMMEGILGVDLGDDIDCSSPEKVMAQVAEKMRQKLVQEEAVEQERHERRGKRKQSAKTLAREAKQQQEAENINQSIRDVYRKLASALHPDRERDAVERDRKTALMQRVNVAYANKDLLQLLELQLEVEQIDQTAIGTISAARLKYYNKILTEQSAELQQEAAAVELSFRMRFNIPPDAPLTPAAVLQDLETDIKGLRRDIAKLKNDLASFQNIANIKHFLKGYRIPPKSFFEAGGFEEMDLAAFFQSR